MDDVRLVLDYILMKIGEQDYEKALRYSKSVLPSKLGSLGGSKPVRLLQRSLRNCVNNEGVALNKDLACKFVNQLFEQKLQSHP